jgi:hypothetical protein
MAGFLRPQRRERHAPRVRRRQSMDRVLGFGFGRTISWLALGPLARFLRDGALRPSHSDNSVWPIDRVRPARV